MGPDRPDPGHPGSRPGLRTSVDGGHSCYKPGEKCRLIYAVREYRGRKDEPKGFGRRGFRDLLVRARIQLGGPIVLVWDNVRLHLTKPLREFIDANATWLTVFQLPTYAPDLNPQEGIWALAKRDIGNLAAVDLGQITRVVKRRLKQIQYRPDLVNGCLVGTVLSMDVSPTVRITFSGSVRCGFRLPGAATGTSRPALPIGGAFGVV
ncbi:transposase [Streptomyces prunicolor]|uniref:transposase n=1 Tax=Streptomyces prunicolor TaxID=67348 RepID=UPI0037D05212